MTPEADSHLASLPKLSPIDEEHKGIARHVLRLSKGRKKDDTEVKEKEKGHSKDSRKDSDTSSNKSLVLNGEGLDSVGVSVVKNQAKVSVDAIELWSLDSGQRSEDHLVANGNNSSAHKSERGGGEGEIRSRPNSFHGATVNPESYSTDL